MPTPALTPAQNAARRVYDWTGVKLTREQTAQILYQAGFRGQALVDMVAIAGRESNYRPGIHGTASPKERVSGDRGLFGINYSNDKALMAAGIIHDPKDLFDPVINAKAAYYMSSGGSNLFPWGAMKGGWAAGGDPFYGANRGAAQAAVDNAGQQGLLGRDWQTGGGAAVPGATPDDPLGWKQIAADIDTGRNQYQSYLNTLTPDERTWYIESLKPDRSLPEVGAFMEQTSPETRDFIGFLSKFPDRAKQLEIINQLSATGAPAAAGAPAADPAQSKELTDLLGRFGVNYPNAPAPTPALLAFLRGVGSSLSTAEDLKRRATERLSANAADANADIARTGERSKQNVTADLIRRGVLQSGEAGTRYARHAEDIAARQSDVARAQSAGVEQAEGAYQQSADAARQAALERVLSTEQEQNITTRTQQAQTDAYAAQQRAADLAWQREQDAMNAALARQEQLIQQYAQQGVQV